MAKNKAETGPRRQALLVLGMHRSGTSAISGLLGMLGAQVPKTLLPPTKDNPRGYFESFELMKANDRVLGSAGSRWNDWGQFNPGWYDSLVAGELRGSLGELVNEEYGTAPLVLIKDPRISRFLPLWLDVLGDLRIAPRIVIPVRHPLAVASSLQVRNNFGRNRSLLLWLRHMLDAEASSRHLPRTFVSYEQVLADWQVEARRMGQELDIAWPKWSGDTALKVGDFLTGELRHHNEGKQSIPGDSEMAGWVRQTYEVLRHGCEQPLDQAMFDRLDNMRREFNRTSEVYAPVVREHEERVEALYADLKAKLAQSVEKCQAQADKLARAEGRVSEAVLIQDEHHREPGVFRGAMGAEELFKVRQTMMDEHLALQAAASAEHSRQLAEKNSELSRLTERLNAMAAESANVDAKHQAELQSLRGQLQNRDDTVASLSEELSQLRSSMQAQAMELNRALAGAETAAKVRFRETAKLTEMLFASEATASKNASRVQELSKSLSECERLGKRLATVLEYRAAWTHSTLSRRSHAWQQQAVTYGEVLKRIGSSRALNALSRLHKIRVPTVREPDVDGVVDLQVEMLRASELFDAQWYQARYPEAAQSELEPERHYLLMGAPAGYSPGPQFDSVAYLMEYPDVREAGVDPLLHYLQFGQAESRTRTEPAEVHE